MWREKENAPAGGRDVFKERTKPEGSSTPTKVTPRPVPNQPHEPKGQIFDPPTCAICLFPQYYEDCQVIDGKNVCPSCIDDMKRHEREIDNGKRCAWCSERFRRDEESREVFSFKLHIACEREYAKWTDADRPIVVELRNDKAVA